MTFKTYLKYRSEFIKQWENTEKNSLGFILLDKFKIRDLRRFIFIFSYDFRHSRFNNINSSIVTSKPYYIRGNVPVKTIKIDGYSFFDKYPEDFDKAQKLYGNPQSKTK
ncbi:hypothetical protein ABE425_14725 [Chryseobacterium cucumeris]|uniref:hypothetical protein n=1 Tax=Chryseobacterium cucumeris TaxID=1813611 RepID=UPI00320B5BB2